MIGIYKIESKTTGNLYVGSAVRIKDRWGLHIRSLNKSKHHSIVLQRRYNKYGLEDLEFEILEFCEPDKCIEIENKWLQYYIENFNVYNINKIHPTKLGYITSEETKLKISKSRNKKKVFQFDFNGNLIKEWECFNHILKEFPNGQSSIWRCLNDLQQTSNNYIWSYNKIFEFKSFNQSKPVLQYDLNDNFIKEWKSSKEAEKTLNIFGVNACCRNIRKTAGKFKWKYKNE